MPMRTLIIIIIIVAFAFVIWATGRYANRCGEYISSTCDVHGRCVRVDAALSGMTCDGDGVCSPLMTFANVPDECHEVQPNATSNYRRSRSRMGRREEAWTHATPRTATRLGSQRRHA
jgi:hypothetical protein